MASCVDGKWKEALIDWRQTKSKQKQFNTINKDDSYCSTATFYTCCQCLDNLNVLVSTSIGRNVVLTRKHNWWSDVSFIDKQFHVGGLIWYVDYRGPIWAPLPLSDPMFSTLESDRIHKTQFLENTDVWQEQHQINWYSVDKCSYIGRLALSLSTVQWFNYISNNLMETQHHCMITKVTASDNFTELHFRNWNWML